jgi:hypothetical protein
MRHRLTSTTPGTARELARMEETRRRFGLGAMLAMIMLFAGIGLMAPTKGPSTAAGPQLPRVNTAAAR